MLFIFHAKFEAKSAMDRGMETMKHFALTTSVKGIPRVVKSKSKPIRLLWTVCIIGFLTAAILQATSLTIDYLRYGSTTAIYEYRPDYHRFKTNKDFFPDVSFCNTNPFGGHADLVQDVPTLKEFYDRVMNVTSCVNCSSAKTQNLKGLRESLLTPAAYSIFIGPDNVRKIGHTLETMLVDCQLILIDGQFFTYIPCFPDTEVLYRFDLKYYNCYTLRLPLPSGRDLPLVGISLVIHLDDHFKEHRKYFDPKNVRNHMGGLELNIYRPYTLPRGDFHEMFIPAGFLTDIKLKYQLRSRLKYPYGNCTDHFKVDLPHDRIYTRDYCVVECIQHHVTKTCGCVDFSVFTELNHFYQNITSCFSLHQTREDLLQMYECVTQQRLVAIIDCPSRCSIECNELNYDSQVWRI